MNTLRDLPGSEAAETARKFKTQIAVLQSSKIHTGSNHAGAVIIGTARSGKHIAGRYRDFGGPADRVAALSLEAAPPRAPKF
jgi:hypothetical protein